MTATLDALPRCRRWWLIALTAVLLAIVPAALVVTYSAWQARRDLAAARAEIDRADPDWRWDDLQAARRPVPDAENSALRVVEAHRRLPKPWHVFATVETTPGQTIGDDERTELENSFDEIGPVQQFRPDQIAGLKAEVARLAGPLEALRELPDLPSGRYPMKPLTAGGVVPMMSNLSQLREATRVLQYQSRLQAQEGQPEAALTTARGILGAARSIGDEGTLLAFLVRAATRANAVGQLERILAQGQPGGEALLTAQRAVENELAEPAFVAATRGERAYNEFFFEQWETGGIDTVYLDAMFADPETALATALGSGPTKPTGNATVDKWIHRYVPRGWSRHDLAAVLRYNTRVVQAATRPAAERPAIFDEVETSRAGLRLAVRNATVGWGRMIQACQRSEAQLASAAAALAAERFRRDKGRWPASLKELVPVYLREVPIDPCDGKPLRSGRAADGFVVYSVGKDGVDDGGDVHAHPGEPQWVPGKDVGFQLWDADKRRQPAPPKPPKPSPTDDGSLPADAPPEKPSEG